MFAYMRRPALAGLVALASLAPGVFAAVAATPPAMRINGWSNPPVGYGDFCKNFPQECVPIGGAAAEALTVHHWQDLEEVNTFVNRIIIPETDLEAHRREELWTLPEIYGDCEDFVLLKRKWLMERGWPSGALLVSVVFDEVGDGHAVLLARTDGGEYVLDNKTDVIRPWYATAYRFVKRQSVEDPNRWVSLGDPRWTASSTAASR
jgi:predicted transglutaminase-like cysteine proteinase